MNGRIVELNLEVNSINNGFLRYLDFGLKFNYLKQTKEGR